MESIESPELTKDHDYLLDLQRQHLTTMSLTEFEEFIVENANQIPKGVLYVKRYDHWRPAKILSMDEDGKTLIVYEVNGKKKFNLVEMEHLLRGSFYYKPIFTGHHKRWPIILDELRNPPLKLELKSDSSI